MNKLLLFTVLLCLLTVNIAVGQYVKLLDFEGTSNGSNPKGSLISDGTFLYGMTEFGGTNNIGTIFKIKPDGTEFVKLLDFDDITNGSNPWGSLISDGTFLYGMTTYGGKYGNGTIFKIMPDGTGYKTLLDFDDTFNGSTPGGSLFYDGTFLYGMTEWGGYIGFGTIFKIKPDGTEYVKLLDFEGALNGKNPRGSLIYDGTFLYGTTSQGGTLGWWGTIFKIMPDGTWYTKLLDFESNSNGSSPWGSLISDGTYLYGMTSEGGTNNLGTIFKIMPDGTGYVKLLDFEGLLNGKNPLGSLIYDGTFLFGMTAAGGTNDMGTIFKIMPDGTGYVKLLDLDQTKGSYPVGSLVSVESFLYGMTSEGGTNGKGTIFKLKGIIGLDEMIISNNLKIFPNPARDYITIESETTESNIIMINATGKVVYQQNTDNTKSAINTSALSNGIYLVMISGDGQLRYSKLIINR